MQVLSLAHFQSIEYIIKGEDYNFISMHLTPAHLLSRDPVDASLFAKIQMDGEGAQWYVDDNSTKYQSITTASPEDRIAALQDLKMRKPRVIETLTQQNIPYAEELFMVPSEDQIFCYKKDGVVRAVLCQWGFRKRHDSAGKDIISFLMDTVPDPPKPVNVRFVALGTDGKPLGDHPFKLKWVGVNLQDFYTEDDGTYSLGSMMPGAVFVIIDQKGVEQPFKVEPFVTDYSAVYPVYASFTIRVSNQEDDPKPSYKIAVNDAEVLTDSSGLYNETNIELKPESTVRVSDDTGHSEIFILDRGENLCQFRVSDRFFSSLRIHSQWEDGEPIAGYVLVVNGENMECDNDGDIVLNDLDPGSTFTVYPADNLNNKQEITLQRGANELLIQKAKVPPQDVRIRLFDHKGRPLSNLHVHFKMASGPFEADTDANGCIYMPEALFSDKEIVQFSFKYEDPAKKGKR